jgi:hypothetical protein
MIPSTMMKIMNPKSVDEPEVPDSALANKDNTKATTVITATTGIATAIKLAVKPSFFPDSNDIPDQWAIFCGYLGISFSQVTKQILS